MPRGIGKKIVWVVLAAVLVWVASNALGYAGPTEISGEYLLVDIEVAVEDTELVDAFLRDMQVTVEFVNGRVEFTGPCNSQSSKFFRVGDRLISVPGFKTSRLCARDEFSDGDGTRVDFIVQSPARWLSRVEVDDSSGIVTWSQGDVTLRLERSITISIP